MNNKLLISIWVVLLFNNIDVIGQTSVSGPSCVLLGYDYQYNFTGKLDSLAQACVTGGIIVGDSSLCTSNISCGYIKVIWNSSSGNISFRTSEGNYNLNISSTTLLDPGIIDSALKTQNISYNSIPTSILCSEAIGGDCQSSYFYQWEQADDNINWKDIAGAIYQNLSFSTPLTKTLFYRRKTIETNSHSIVYTKEAVVYIDVDSSGHQ